MKKRDRKPGHMVDVMELLSGGYSGRSFGKPFRGIKPAWNLDLKKTVNMMIIDKDFNDIS